MNPNLRERWSRLWQSIGAKTDGQAQFAELVLHYNEPGRVYYNLSHIEHCLEEFEEVKTLISNPEIVELALWFHDAVNDPRALNNEEDSAEMAALVLEAAGVHNPYLRSVLFFCIWVTDHKLTPASEDERFTVDIDLAIFGQSPERFDEYERQIRLEYNFMLEDEFRQGRQEILERFLKRSTIYYTKHFQAKYEQQARENLKRSILQLQGGL